MFFYLVFVFIKTPESFANEKDQNYQKQKQAITFSLIYLAVTFLAYQGVQLGFHGKGEWLLTVCYPFLFFIIACVLDGGWIHRGKSIFAKGILATFFFWVLFGVSSVGSTFSAANFLDLSKLQGASYLMLANLNRCLYSSDDVCYEYYQKIKQFLGKQERIRLAAAFASRYVDNELFSQINDSEKVKQAIESAKSYSSFVRRKYFYLLGQGLFDSSQNFTATLRLLQPLRQISASWYVIAVYGVFDQYYLPLKTIRGASSKNVSSHQLYRAEYERMLGWSTGFHAIDSQLAWEFSGKEIKNFLYEHARNLDQQQKKFFYRGAGARLMAEWMDRPFETGEKILEMQQMVFSQEAIWLFQGAGYHKERFGRLRITSLFEQSIKPFLGPEFVAAFENGQNRYYERIGYAEILMQTSFPARTWRS